MRPVSDPDGNLQSFTDIRIWIFDLDNTLYPAHCNLFAQVDHRMGAFIAQFLAIPLDQARLLQKQYYYDYGTTLAGMMARHDMKPALFLDFVHDIDLSAVPELPELNRAIANLPGRKLIYTNGSYRHAERVARKLGVLQLFDGITDIVATNYIPKPKAEAYHKMLQVQGINSADVHQAAMFEDLPHNLIVPHELGMTTILVHSDYMDHPVQNEIKDWTRSPPYIHHRTYELTQFLQTLQPIS